MLAEARVIWEDRNSIEEVPPSDCLWASLFTFVNDWCGRCHPWAGGPQLQRKTTEQAMKRSNKLCSSVVSAEGPASRFLPSLSSCLSIPLWYTVIGTHRLHKPFPPQLLWVTVFIAIVENKPGHPPKKRHGSESSECYWSRSWNRWCRSHYTSPGHGGATPSYHPNSLLWIRGQFKWEDQDLLGSHLRGCPLGPCLKGLKTSQSVQTHEMVRGISHSNHDSSLTQFPHFTGTQLCVAKGTILFIYLGHWKNEHLEVGGDKQEPLWLQGDFHRVGEMEMLSAQESILNPAAWKVKTGAA